MNYELYYIDNQFYIINYAQYIILNIALASLTFVKLIISGL